jgi:hypothetical protein
MTTSMTTTITLTPTELETLDLSPAQAILDPWLHGIDPEPQISFAIDLPREPGDPRELSEIPEVRLWFIRLDAQYPWLPYILDWEAGELARYVAMLVPHQFSAAEGIQFNPEALEIFVMSKVFILADWMQRHEITSRSKLKFMTQMLGYELDDGFFELVGI